MRPLGGSTMWPARLFIPALVMCASSSDGQNDENALGNDTNPNTTQPYIAPLVEGLHWLETFDGDVWSRWAKATDEKYNGQFEVATRTKEALVGDLGLLVPTEARHYGVAVKFEPIKGQEGVAFAVQFEAKFQDGMSCGGSYIKLFDSNGKLPSEFKDDTGYVIMFGPDKCGSTDKVHFILQHKNPKTGRWEEKHCKDPPSVPGDHLTHLYTLIIRPDNSFEIQVDGVRKTSGNLLTSMQPPINPPKEVDDPSDKKPTDWVDDAKIDDPSVRKPDDWDEDAPMQIVDPKASKPSGWNDDAPKRIPDPSAKKPEDWDDDEDGDWEAPVIDNPACRVGCGKWEAPKISNPAYKGKWYAPKIDNPAYKGVWKPRQIENPDYFVDEAPCILPKIDSIGIDIWTMSKSILFDNLAISSDASLLKELADKSWKLRKNLEELQEPKFNKDTAGGIWDMTKKYGIPASVTLGIVLVTTVWCCCFSSSNATPPPKKPKKRGKDVNQAQEGINEEEKNEAVGTEAVESEETTEESHGKDSRPKGEETKAEGGLGDLSGDSSNRD